ncbi:hypothetical protein FQR65_LT01640 [Abscondita terminalis]|nr:hypothetical protein FQR65_LT01640 [Abscondita terminalis]
MTSESKPKTNKEADDSQSGVSSQVMLPNITEMFVDLKKEIVLKYLNSAHLKMAGKFKFSFTKKNTAPYRRPESLVYRPSEVDYKLCHEARKSYGVTTDEDCKQNLEQHSGSYELEDYIVLTTDLNAVRFAPRKSDEKYQLYLGLSSLQSIRKMKNYFISRMKKLEKCDFQFNQFIENVVDVIDKKKNIGYEEVLDMNEIGYEEFNKVLNETHKDNNMLQDLVYKFPHYVTVQVKNYIESYVDRFLYK